MKSTYWTNIMWIGIFFEKQSVSTATFDGVIYVEDRRMGYQKP